MFRKVFEYAGPHKKGLYGATFLVLLSVLMGVLPFVLAYQEVTGGALTTALTPAYITAHCRRCFTDGD